VEKTVGTDQPVPADQRRHRAAFRRRRPKHSSAVYGERLGLPAAFGARAYPNTKKWYGTSGNSFVAVVEFGDSVRAQRSPPGAKTRSAIAALNDQRNATPPAGCANVYFYRSQLVGHTER